MGNMTLQFVVALLATLPFSILFNAPRRFYLLCTVGGGVCWLVYLAIFGACQSIPVACFVATLFLTLYARMAGVLCQAPVIVFLTTGIFTLVPGAAIYYTVFYLFTGQAALAGGKAFEALITAGSIALGMVFGYALPHTLFLKAGGALSRLFKKRGRG